MSDEKDLPGIPGTVDSALRRPLEAMRESIQRLMGMRGADGRAAVRWDDLADEGLASLPRRRILINQAIAQGGAGSGSGTGGGAYVPDLTKPPTPTGLTAVAGFSNVLAEWTAPSYTVGHGNKQTNIYATKQPASDATLYTISDAVRVDVVPGAMDVRALVSDLGIKWRIWIRFESVDGVESDPAGGVNGFVVTTGKVGTADLNDAIIEAAQLADGSISASKFTAGVEPVTIISSGSLPTTKSTSTIFYGGKLYRWSGTAYVFTTPTSDLTGTVSDAQIAGLAASKVTGTLTDAQLAAISAAKVTGQIVATQITDGSITTSKLFAGSVTTAKIAADAVTANEIAAGAVTASEIAAGAVTTAKLAAGAVTANEISAGAVTAGKVAANAITANELAADSVTAGKVAAGAITTNKLLVTGQGASLWIDPNVQDPSAWRVSQWGVIPTQTTVTDGRTGDKTLRSGASSSSAEGARRVPISEGKRYRVSCYARRNAASNGTLYLRVAWGTDESGSAYNQLYPGGANLTTYSGSVEGVVPGTTWARYYWEFVAGSAPKFMSPIVILNYAASAGWMEAQDIRIEEMVGADLIVDGSILATKIAANAIAVGTAAIQNGAIVNAMIGTAAIDDAKVANLSAAKLTAGDGTIGGDLKSSGFVAGSSGWRVRYDGSAEFSNVVIRGATYTGTIYANAGTIGGITIASSYMRAGQLGFDNGTGFYLGSDGTFSIGNSSGNKLTWNGSVLNIVGGGTFSGSLSGATGTFAGSLSAATGTFSGSLSAAGGTFAGNLSAAGGTFAGTMTAAAINAVNTINIAGNAVTVPTQASWSGFTNTYSTLVTTPNTDFGGGAVLVICQLCYDADSGYCSANLYRNGSLLTYLDGGRTITMVYIDYPGAGTFNYGVSNRNGTVGGYVTDARVVAMGAKR